MNLSKKRYIFFTLIFIPIFIIIGEFLSYSFLKIQKFRNNSNSSVIDLVVKVLDVITGTNRFDITNKGFRNTDSYINKHGLIKTDFVSNEREDKEIKGILITGNSVAMGYPLIEEGKYFDSFVNRLEALLRKKDNKIDIINLSYSGFNSWQENINVARYFNSESNHNDLPSEIELIASLGGIQDFWNFIDLLYMDPNEKSEFYKANGLMTGQSGSDNFVEYNKALNGDINSILKVVLIGIVRNITRESQIYKLIETFKSKPTKSNNTDSTFKINDKQNELSLLITNKLKISSEEYEKRKNMVIFSVTRNLNSMSALNHNGKIMFVYLPTRLSHTSNDVKRRYRFKNLNIKDLYILEKDFKDALVKHLSITKDIYVFDLANSASWSWFVDESHFSAEGHKKIANKLAPLFEKVLKK